MMRMFLMVGLVGAGLALNACGGGPKYNPLEVPEAQLGPNTGDLLKELPPGLVGDKENARYTNERLRGEDETP